MEAFQKELLPEFMKGNHVMHHNSGTWNGIWSDTYIETTFMRYGHEAGGLIGITLQPSAVARWALSLHICSQLQPRRRVAKTKSSHTTRTSLMPGNRQTPLIERRYGTHWPHSSVHWTRQATLLVLWTLLLAPSNVNVDSSVTIGTQQMEEYESGWPQSFHRVLNKLIITMAVSKKSKRSTTHRSMTRTWYTSER